MFRKPIIFLLTLIFLILAITPCIQAVPASLTLSGRIIILDPGHASDTTNRYAGYDEQVTMLKLAQRIKPLLESHGAAVYLTRETYDPILLPARAAKVNILALETLRAARLRELAGDGNEANNISEAGGSQGISGMNGETEYTSEIDRLLGILRSIADDPDTNGGIYMNTPFEPGRSIHPDLAKVFDLQNNPEIGSRFLVISLHSNATRTPITSSASGAVAFYISSTHKNTANYYTGYSYTDQSCSFGNTLLDHIDAAGLQRRRLTLENYFMIREHNVPGVLVENGFHTNDRDRAKLLDDSFLDRLALAYLDAITAYFDKIPLPGEHPALPYSDVSSEAWYFEAVKYVTEQGLLRGTELALFSPDGRMTRAMLITVLARLGNADVSVYNETSYVDVPIDAWYGKAVAWAADKGITDFIGGGNGDVTGGSLGGGADDAANGGAGINGSPVFGPDQYATREEIAVMIFNYFRWKGLVPPNISTVLFEDDADISGWAETAIYALRELGIMKGDTANRFNPRDTATRAEVAQIFYNALIFTDIESF